VQNADGQNVANHETLADAHQAWQQQTEQSGRIIDRETGEDVTPPPDDNGRYVVLDRYDNQVGSFDHQAQAEEIWRERTNTKGKIIDTLTKEDVTPKDRQVLNKAQIDQAFSELAGKGVPYDRTYQIDLDLIREMMAQINRLAVPIFDVANITGKGRSRPTRTVPIVRREVTIVKDRRKIEIDAPGPRKPSGRLEVPYPTEDADNEPIRGPGDLGRVSPRQFAVPRRLLQHRIVNRQLTRRTFHEEVPGKPTIRKRKVWQEYERPEVKEWTEQVEVSEDPQAQLAEIVIDVSGSMDLHRVCMAIALAAVVIGAHLDDDSMYILRTFASTISDETLAKTPKQKRDMLQLLLRTDTNLGGGTQLLLAISTASRDVRRFATNDDQPEVLLITDGHDDVTSSDIYDAIGNDVVLHTVIVNATNHSLRSRSSTYYELWYRGYAVTGNGKNY
jgi:hypothetical protein